MMSRWDHYTEATRLLEDARPLAGSLAAQYAVTAALAHATLANYTGPVLSNPSRQETVPVQSLIDEGIISVREA